MDRTPKIACILAMLWSLWPTAAPAANAQSDRVSGTEKGSLLVFSDVQVRWDDQGRLVADTFLSLANDFPQDVLVKLYYVNGDPPLDAVGEPGASGYERAHAGWNHVDSVINLTRDEPTYFAAATGWPKGVSPFTVLDGAVPPELPGRPAPDGSGDRVLRGIVLAWAVNVLDEEISWNHLTGQAVVVDYRDGTAWEYNAWSFQVVAPVATGAATGVPPSGRLDLDGVEYVPAFSLLQLDFYAVGSVAFSGGSPFQFTSIDTSLTLHPIDLDLRQESSGPVTTKASFLVWNEDETQFSGQHRCLTCWDQALLSQYGPIANHFLMANLQTDRGKARINGVASTNCSSTCCIARTAPGDTPGCEDNLCQQAVCEVEPLCCSTAWDDTCVWIAVDLCETCEGPNRNAALLGVAARHLAMNGLPTSVAGANLTGMGLESASISYDVFAAPPPPGGNEAHASKRSPRRGPASRDGISPSN